MFVDSGTLGFGAIPIVRPAAGRARPHARNVAEGLVSLGWVGKAKGIVPIHRPGVRQVRSAAPAPGTS